MSTPGANTVACPNCGHEFAIVAASAEHMGRLTEAAAAPAAADVEYADPGFQKDGKKRYPLDTAKHVRAAWSYINQGKNAALYTKKQLNQIRAKIKKAAAKLGVTIADQATEALINGKLSYSDLCDLVRAAVQQRVSAALGAGGYCYVYVVDLTDTDVVYMAGDNDLWQCSYTVTTGPDGDNSIELGDPVEVARTYAPIAAGEDVDPAGSLPEATEDAIELGATGASEARRDTIVGRVVEARGTDDETGGRIFRVQVIAYGDSKNGRRYPESVMRAAAPLYDGAKAYDHHRTDAEMATSTISGLVGYYRSPEATDGGIEADLYLLPSAAHAAEALDASLAAQADGLSPLIGVSHDVMATYRPVVQGAVRLQEATAIVEVNSADLVANPAAGGQATRMVAGGVTPSDLAGSVPAGKTAKETDVALTKVDILAALKEATVDELAAVGLSKVSTTKATEAETAGELKTSFLGKMLVRAKVIDAGLPETVVESVIESLPDRITEATVDAQIGSIKAALGIAERSGLEPRHTAVVTKEARQKKVDALDAFFAGDYAKGYRSFKEAFVDFTGKRPRAFDEDFNRTILAESFGGGFTSAGRSGGRSTESMDSASWNLVLGDSITRRMVAMYAQPSLQTWRQVVSSTPPIQDFRAQRIERIGGYGVLPAVAQGQPYQPLTSPGNEEAEYSITKRGGTEDFTLEMLANDDIRAIQQLPAKLGLAAAQTLYRFVFDLFQTNAATSYDEVAVFHTDHANTASAALSQTSLSAGRKAMRQQAAFGDSKDVLSIVPKFLLTPSSLEEIAFQLCTSAVAIPATPAGPTDTPNIHQGLTPIVVDYWDSTTSWFTVADTAMTPTIEVGFYQGREDPELFTQADPSVGSVFNADKITYKIRHIYSGTVLDHRGLYRGNS